MTHQQMASSVSYSKETVMSSEDMASIMESGRRLRKAQAHLADILLHDLYGQPDQLVAQPVVSHQKEYIENIREISALTGRKNPDGLSPEEYADRLLRDRPGFCGR